jgi:hypothetical protein
MWALGSCCAAAREPPGSCEQALPGHLGPGEEAELGRPRGTNAGQPGEGIRGGARAPL